MGIGYWALYRGAWSPMGLSSCFKVPGGLELSWPETSEQLQPRHEIILGRSMQSQLRVNSAGRTVPPMCISFQAR